MAALMTRFRLCLLTMISALPLTACASQRDYPSLAIRDVERITGVAEPVTPEMPNPAPSSPAPIPPDAPLSASIANLVAQAQAAHATFTGKRDSVERLVAAGSSAPIGSEAWATTNVALSDLESARSQTMIALAELDNLYAEERLANYNEETPEAKAIAASRDRIANWIEAENTVLSGLRAQMGE